MANTYALLASSTVGAGGSAAITFSSIPQTYTDLCIVYSLRTNAGYQWDTFNATINGSTSSFSQIRLLGFNGVTYPNNAQSDTLSLAFGTANGGTNSTSSTFSNGSIYFPSYTSSNYKTIVLDGAVENNGNTQLTSLQSGLWSNSAAITSITISNSNTIQQYSTAYLYGIKNS